MATTPAGGILRDPPVSLAAEIGRDTSDRHLLEQFVAQRDETAFVGLVQRHSRTVWAVCRRVLQHEQDAEDAFQAVFLVLARRAASIQKKEAVGSWLYGVAYRTAMKARQLAARRQKNQKQVNEAKPVESASSEAALRELQRLLDEEVQRLADEYRAPFVLCCLEGMSKPEAAKELGWKEGTVSGRLARVRKLLQSRLARRGVMLSAALTAIALAQNSADAAVPAGLLQSASSPHAGAATLSPAATNLADAVMRSMAGTRSPLGMSLLLALLLTLAGTGLIAWHWGFGADSFAAAAPDPDTFLPPAVALGTPIDQQVAAVVFSLDGKRLVTAGGKSATPGQLKVWDTETAKELHDISRIPGVRTMAFSPAGQTLATGDASGAITLRDPVTGIERTRVQGHTGAVLGLAFSPRGDWLASTGADHKVKLWSADGLREHKVLEGHTGPVSAVAFFRGGQALVTASEDKTAKIWDLQTGKEKFTLTGHQSAVEAAAISPDNRFVATASADQTVRIWDAETGGQTAVLEGNFAPFFAVAYSPDGTLLAGGGRDGKIRLWNAKTLQPLGTLDDHKGAVWALAFSKDGVLASGSADRTAKLWPMLIGDKTARTLTTHWTGIRPIQAVAYAPDGLHLAVATTDKTVHLRDAQSGDVLRVLTGHTDIVNCAAFSSDGATLASGSNDQTIKLWDRATGEEIGTLTGHTGGVLALVFTSGGKTLVSAGNDKTIRVWNLATGKETGELQGHDAPIHALALTPDDRTLASGSADRTIKIWDLAKLTETMTLKGHAGTVRAIAFSSAGALASGGEDGTVKLWNLPAGTERLSLDGHRDVWTLAFTAQGRTLVSGGKDGTVRVWDPVSGELRGILKGHKGPVTALAIHPRGEHLISGSHDTLLYRWPAGKLVPKVDEHFVAVQDGNQKEEPAAAKTTMIFRQDFRGQKIDEKFLKLIPDDGQNQIKEEPQGLRISLPGDNPKRQPTGVQTQSRIQGDFDITLSYELLQADRPTKGFGIGVSLYLTTDSPTKDAIQLSRVNRKDGSFYGCGKMTTDKGGKRLTLPGKVIPTEARAGKLRLMRRGALAMFLVADDGRDDFREIYRCELGREDVLFVRAAGEPGNEESPPLEARLLDLEIRRAATAAKKNYAQDYFHSFQGKPDNSQPFELRGPDAESCVKYEPDGLRLTLPAGFPEQRPGTGLALVAPVKGDFEITLSFEILKEPDPGDAGKLNSSTRLSLGVLLDTPERNEASINRRQDVNGVRNYSTYLSMLDEAGGKPLAKVNYFKTETKIGKLRLVRAGSVVSLYASQGPNGDLTFLKEYPFSPLDLKQVYLVTSTGGPKAALDVRVTDLRICADSLPSLAVPKRKQAWEYFQSFKGKPDNTPAFELTGPDAEKLVRYEADGLRISLPLGHPDQRRGTGVSLASPVHGDFDITMKFEILKEPEAADAGKKYGTRLSLGVHLDTPEKNEVSASRRIDKNGTTQFVSYLYMAKYAADDTPKPGYLRTSTKTGRLRLARTGSALSTYVSEGADDEFKLLKEYTFSALPLKSVYITASTGGPEAALDVRVSDLRIRADSLPNLPAVQVAAEPLPPAPPGAPVAAAQSRSKPWLMASLLIGMLLTLAVAVAVGVWLYLRGRAASTTTPEHGAGTATQEAPKPAPSMISLQCSECGKKLKVKPALAGKKVKCSQCGKEVLVPEES